MASWGRVCLTARCLRVSSCHVVQVPMCPRPGEPPLLVKYGVMSVSDLLDDLVTWRHLYAAGRLHKPVVRLGEGGEAKEEVAAGQRRNQDAALAAALLLLPHRFTTRQLLSTIVGACRMAFASSFKLCTAVCLHGGLPVPASAALRGLAFNWRGEFMVSDAPQWLAPLDDVFGDQFLAPRARCAGLSYSGDVRLGLAEDARKVERLVSGGRAELEEVYVRRGLLLTQALAGGGGASTACSGEAEGQWHVFNSPAKLAGVVKEAEEHASDRVTRQTCGVDGGSRSSNDTVVIGGGEGCSWRQDVGMASRRSLLEALPVALLAEVAKQAGAWPQQVRSSVWHCGWCWAASVISHPFVKE